ncbi:acyl-ACP--UDP-N-acetylglucosamine O-acyltransferase [Algiphilus sp.]|uniref:acyl-ACP--UDP-N-acetylglucosamine O-acyltransferase n=1 Tax=Algiphilus sp. TaxID=1872431 RepID=UPI003B51DB3D
MNADIHPTAIVEDGAELDPTVSVGAYSIIGAGVRLGAECIVGPHVVLRGPLRAGRGNRFFQFCSIGEISQDLTAREEDDTAVEIGDGNTFREYVTVQRGTLKDHGVTTVGNNNLLMNQVHLAHDCRIGNHNILANGVALAGHVDIEDYAILGGFTLVHQFCRMGSYCFTGGGSVVLRDVPPWVMSEGSPAGPRGINKEGLRRRGFDAEQIREVQSLYKLLYRENRRLSEVRELLRERAETSPQAARLLRFLEQSKRAVQR